jgi:3-hydroxybutyryl-CoA dehydrogenase
MSLPHRIGVIGGGRMGAGIAQVVLARHCEVAMVEADEQACRAGAERVRSGLEQARRKGGLDQAPDEAMAHLAVGTDAAILAGCGLVVEAVFEDPQLKVLVLGRAASVVGPEAVLATNTSSISIDELAGGLPDPGRFLGMHFFNPVAVSSLVELVQGEATRPEVVEAATGWVEDLGKTPVVVRDRPGFATSRLGVLLGLEAVRMLEEGVASAEDIDTAMELGYRHPMGPLRLTDLVGLDVRLGIARYLAERLGERYRPPQLLIDKVERGELGRKAGRGFYDWRQ